MTCLANCVAPSMDGNRRWRFPVEQQWCSPLKRSFVAAKKVRPNPSLERTSTGLALGPRTGQCHHPLRGPSANPVGSAQLKR